MSKIVLEGRLDLEKFALRELVTLADVRRALV